MSYHFVFDRMDRVTNKGIHLRPIEALKDGVLFQRMDAEDVTSSCLTIRLQKCSNRRTGYTNDIITAGRMTIFEHGAWTLGHIPIKMGSLV